MHESQLRDGRVGPLAAVLAVVLAVLALLAATAAANPTSLTAESGGAVVIGAAPVGMGFPLVRSGDLSYDTWVQYRTENGTALAGANYEAASGSILIPAGETEASIPVQALGASAYSPDKQFSLRLGAVGVGPTPSFAAPETRATGEGPKSVAEADINGDGTSDLLVANSSVDAFSVWLNTTTPGASAPSYAPEQVFAAGRGPRSVLAADLNGDGRPDLVVVNNQIDERAISVFLNTTELGSATASFAARQVVGPGTNPLHLDAADLNGDGRLDLVVGNALINDYVTVLMNTTAAGATSPSFAPPEDVVAGDGSFTPQLADLNGDGRPDLVVGNGAAQGKQAASVLLNTTAPGASSPSFSAPTEFAVEGPAPRSVAVADFNGDGRPDLAVASWGIRWLSVLINTTVPGAGAPSFAPQEVILGLPSGFKEWISSDDYNGDGKSDLALVSLGGANLSVLANTTPPGADVPSFFLAQNVNSPEFGLLAWVGISEVNGDGKPDLVVAHGTANGKISVLLNTTAPPTVTAPNFASEQPFATGEAPSAIAQADVNGDGKRDLLVANREDDSASVLLNTTAPGATAPSFTAETPFAAGQAPSAVASADVNGDGKRDLLVANQDDDSASVLLNTTAPGAAAPSFAAAAAFATGAGPSGIVATDINGDGRADLLIANQEDDSVSVLLNTTAPGAGAPSFAAETSFATGDGPSAIAEADVSGDGRADLLIANQEDDSISVLLNTTSPGASTPSFAAAVPFATGEGPSAIAVADLNGDGSPDLLSANRAAGGVSALLDNRYAAALSPTSVTGTIQYAIPRVSLGPSPVAFGEQLVGSDAQTTVTLSNTGGAEMAVAGIAIDGSGAGQLSQENDCPATLPVGASCAIVLTYAPSTVGAASATLTVTTDAPSSPNAIALSGMGYDVTPPPPPPPPPPATHTLSVGLAGAGSGTVSTAAGTISCPPSCSQVAAAGTPIGLIATPAPGSSFAGWAGGCTGTGACQLALAADTAVSARFEPRAAEPARLRIRRLRVGLMGARVKVVVAGTVAQAARGKIGLAVLAKSDGRRFKATARPRIRDGRWRARLMLPGLDLGRTARIKARASFQGSATVSDARAKRSVRFAYRKAGKRR